MPEPHHPEQSPEGEEHGFTSSAPDLRPNLEKEQTIFTERHGGMYHTEIVNNDTGREASNLRGDAQFSEASLHAEKQDYQELLAKAERIKSELNDMYELRRLDIDEKERLNKSIDEILTLIDLSKQRLQDNIGRKDDRLDQAVSDSKQHYQANQEAYKNQATIDYLRAREADPERYPEPLNYPSITEGIEQPPTTPEDPTSH
mgnify:CR=1 FL=1